MSTRLFEPSALFITFREAVEAGVIVSVSLAFLRKTNQLHLRKQIFYGVGAGVVASIIVGIIILTAYYKAKQAIFTGSHEMAFEGSIMLIACVMITVVAFAMLRMLYLHLKWQAKLEAETQQRSQNKYALFLVAFTAVFREGVEAVIFITGVSQANPEAIPIPGLLGIVIGSIFSYIVFFGSKPVDIRWFMYITSFIMFAIGAGLLSRGIHEFQEMGAFGYYGDEEGETTEESAGVSDTTYVAEEVPPPLSWANVKLGDFTACCSAEDSSTSFYALLRAIFGYSDAPTRLEIITYMLYWGYVILALAYKSWRGTLWGKFAPKAGGDSTADLAELAAVDEEKAVGKGAQIELLPVGSAQEITELKPVK